MSDVRPWGSSDSEFPLFDTKEFDSLLKKEFQPKSDEAKEKVEQAVRTLAEQALRSTYLISSNARQSIEAMIQSCGPTWSAGRRTNCAASTAKSSSCCVRRCSSAAAGV